MAAVLPRALAALILASALVALLRGGGDHLGPPGRLPRRVRSLHSPRHFRVSRNATAPLLCVVAPHRPRKGVASAEPERFAAYLSRWLPRVAGARRHRVWIVEQRDEYRFNRGWLLNVGAAAARLVDGCDVFALHDVDLLPLDPRLPYASSPTSPSTSPPGIHPEYVPTFPAGGAWLFTWEQLLAVDGYSHAYWGWGQKTTTSAPVSRTPASFPAYPFRIPARDPGTSRHPRPRRRAPAAPTTATPIPARATAAETRTRNTFDSSATSPGRSARGYDFPGTIPRRGSCFAHAHEGGFSRDRLETDPNAVVGGGARPDAVFSEGRRWADVRAGRFRRDETTGAESARAGRVRRIGDRRRRSKSTAEGHGFAVSSVDDARVVVDAAALRAPRTRRKTKRSPPRDRRGTDGAGTPSSGRRASR